MQMLQPKIKALQAKFKGDKQKLQQETMKLYQEYHVNPFASCLPLLLQLPVFICLYYAIRGTPELQQAHFLWLTLGQPDPYYILLIIYVASQLVSTELMMTPTTEKTQKWIMRGMPFIFIIMLRSFPSGLFVYWITTNLWTIGQQLIIRRQTRHVLVAGVMPNQGKPKKQSRFLQAMSAAQQKREGEAPVSGKGGRTGAPSKRTAGAAGAGGKRPAGTGKRPAGAGGKNRPPGQKPGGQAASSPGTSGKPGASKPGGSATGGQKQSAGGGRPSGAPAAKPGAASGGQSQSKSGQAPGKGGPSRPAKRGGKPTGKRPSPGRPASPPRLLGD
jgi:YidC/Oxa1 family membrane protein insertase